MKTIYGLRDPRDLLFRYVGKSSNPGKRLEGHWCHRKTHRCLKNWLQELDEIGLRPELIHLGKDWYELWTWKKLWNDPEEFWINRLLECGHPIQNIALRRTKPDIIYDYPWYHCLHNPERVETEKLAYPDVPVIKPKWSPWDVRLMKARHFERERVWLIRHRDRQRRQLLRLRALPSRALNGFLVW